MRIRPDIFLTSDTHFGHQKMVEWGHRKESHNEDIVKAWNSAVGRDDTVLHLGDLSMANKESTLKWTLKLQGKKYLILGNHDGHSESWYKDCGFTILPNAYYKTHDKYGTDLRVLFTHEPVIPLPEKWFNIHGHLHGDSHRGIETTDHHFDVGVDPLGFKPMRLYQLLDIFKKIHAHEI